MLEAVAIILEMHWMIVFMSAAYARDNFFPHKILSNLGCGLYTNAAYIRVFTLIQNTQWRLNEPMQLTWNKSDCLHQYYKLL